MTTREMLRRVADGTDDFVPYRDRPEHPEGHPMTRVHLATVEEVVDDEGDRAFRAVCLETGAVCDAWAFPEVAGNIVATEYAADEQDGAAIERALCYLGDGRLHEQDSPAYCNARHVTP